MRFHPKASKITPDISSKIIFNILCNAFSVVYQTREKSWNYKEIHLELEIQMDLRSTLASANYHLGIG